MHRRSQRFRQPEEHQQRIQCTQTGCQPKWCGIGEPTERCGVRQAPANVRAQNKAQAECRAYQAKIAGFGIFFTDVCNRRNGDRDASAAKPVEDTAQKQQWDTPPGDAQCEEAIPKTTAGQYHHKHPATTDVIGSGAQNRRTNELRKRVRSNEQTQNECLPLVCHGKRKQAAIVLQHNHCDHRNNDTDAKQVQKDREENRCERQTFILHHTRVSKEKNEVE